jgi:hypothetical protein
MAFLMPLSWGKLNRNAQKGALECRVEMTKTKVDKLTNRDNPHFYWVFMRSRLSTL